MAALLIDPSVADRAPDRAAERVRTVPADRGPVSILPRARLVAACLALVALCLAQQPGRVVADTKLDLTVDPWGFLGRALHMWDSQGFAGHIQDQAYGYLFPMGPFFGLGQSAGLPDWVVQRLWMGLVLCVAFLGFVALARRLGIGTPEIGLAGGLAYALAPRMLTELGAVSIEAWPMALAPWVLVPLVTGARAGSPRRAAALSGLAVFCVGGVNATATATVLPLAALWLLTRPAGPRRRRLTAWWIASVALATAWWAGPLLLLGRYSPPFLDYIENAATTTAPTELVQVLRGASHWVAYLATPLGPQWPAGWALARDAVPMVATVVLAAAGLLALTLRGLRDRSWLVVGLVTGLVLVTAGHVGTVSGLFAEPLQQALDGVLAPLRNVHKFDPVLRLPLTLALVHLATVLVRRARGVDVRAFAARAAVAVLALALAGVASPALAGKLTAPTGFEAVPGYWQDAADWLSDAPDGRALLLPASKFGTYVWGSTGDEPLQPLAGSPWEVRDAVPFTPAGHIRMLDAVEDRLARGEGSAGLTRYLARSGFSYLVVRNDLDSGAAGATRPLLVHRALADSPGVRRVATFGPVVPFSTALPGLALDSYLTPQLPSIEIFAVAGAAPRAWTTPLDEAVTVLGGPDGVLALEEDGLLTDRAALLPEDGAQDAGSTMVTDALVRRERSVGRITGATSAGLSADDPLRLDAPARDYLIPGQELAQSVVRLDGAAVTASSSGADADSFRPVRPEEQPYAAIDGDLGTAWWPASRLGDTQPDWWRVAWAAPRSVTAITVTLAADSATAPPASLRLTTDAGARTVRLAATGAPQRLVLPAGRTRSITLTVTGAPGVIDGRTVGLAEVAVPGLTVTRSVVTPAAAGPTDAFAFEAANPASSGCVADLAGVPRCGAALVHGAEEPRGIDRTFSLAVPATYDVALTAVPRAGPALDALMAGATPRLFAVTSSSQAVPDPRAGPEAVVDGDETTTWMAAGSDPDASLTLSWYLPQVIDTIRVMTSPSSAASIPDTVRVQAGWVTQTVRLDAQGVARIAPVTTDTLVVSFPLVQSLNTFDPYSRAMTPLGVGVTELTVPGTAPLVPDAVVDVPCGQGPVVQIDGQAHDTRLTATVADLRALRPVPVEPCATGLSTGRLDGGEHHFAALGTDAFAVDSATLTRSGAGRAVRPAAGRTAAEVRRWDAEHRVVALPARDGPTLLVVPENANAGWTATLHGATLQARTVDGWQQGYVVPAGAAGEVRLDFLPGTAYRAALIGGLGAVLVLSALILVPGRRPEPGPGRHRAVGGRLLLAGAVAGVVLVGGLVGAVALACLAALAWAVRRGLPHPVAGRLGGGVAAAALLAGGILLVIAPGASGEPARQTLAVVALAAVVVAAFSPGARSGTRVRSRWRGRSTST